VEVYDKCGRLPKIDSGEEFSVGSMQDYDSLDARIGRLLGLYFSPVILKNRQLSECLLATV
jgi:hypothetical protein